MITGDSPLNPFYGSDPAVGQRIGPYKLLERVGEGGCGVVYVADQQRPVRRRVALKIIKLGMDTRQVVARFEAERQALAMMDHPNIAKVLDAGATDTGRPYFVMELVRGIKITEYCDRNKLPTTERLDLFIQVCHAMQHAHQKGVIHRDLKPSNILVTLHDGLPVPKVIDFGIAKATEGRLTDLTLSTELQQFIGTPAYTSPEQVEMRVQDVDTRSDVYSLGVMLYELLTGTTPFDQNELNSLGVDTMRRTILTEEPQRPSMRLGTLTSEVLATTARCCGMEAHQLLHSTRGDLDWIVMKCLEKDRTRRYATANALAADLQRHLENEPIVACRPSTLYRFQKLVRRNKLAFGAGAAVAVAMILGTLVSTSVTFWARRASAEAMRQTDAQRLLEQEAKDTERLLLGRKLFMAKDYKGADALVSNLMPKVIEKEFLTAGPLFRGLGHWHAGGQRWRQSATYFNQLLFGPPHKTEILYELAKVDATADLLTQTPGLPYPLIYFAQAMLLLELGDRDGYEHLRQAMIAKYADGLNLDDPQTADMVLLTALALPPEASDRVTICKCADIVYLHRVEVGPAAFRHWHIALFMYRRGEPEQALKWARKCLGYEPGPALSALARTMNAMAYWKLGREDLAREELDWCREQIDRTFRGEFGVGTIKSGFWGAWLEARLLLREADQLMATTSPGGGAFGSPSPGQTVEPEYPTWDQAMKQAWEEIGGPTQALSGQDALP